MLNSTISCEPITRSSIPCTCGYNLSTINELHAKSPHNLTVINSKTITKTSVQLGKSIVNYIHFLNTLK